MLRLMTPAETLFLERFQGYEIPFTSADQRIAKMEESARKGYYLAAKNLADNEVLKLEIAEWKRKLYTELALRSEDALERQGYRMTLIAIQEFEKRLQSLGNLYASKPLQSLSDKL